MGSMSGNEHLAEHLHMANLCVSPKSRRAGSMDAAMGAWIGGLRRGGKLLIPYRVGVAVAGGYEEVGAADYLLYYFEFEGEVGVAVNYSGFQPSAGLYVTGISGRIDTDIGFAGRTDDLYGFNGGAYAELKYENKRSPVYGRVRGVIGDVEGVSVGLGMKF